MKDLVVLSLCDGISTGQYILNDLGFNIKEYYASEIDKSAIKVTQWHFPNTIQIGDMKQVTYKNGILYTENGVFNVGKIDLVLSGTPCVSFSIAGKKENMNGLSGELFYEFLRVLKEVEPTYYFFENVKMKENVALEISKALGNDYIYLNSSDFSAQVRKRYYWTNIVDRDECLLSYIPKNLYLKDVIDNKVPFDINCDIIFEEAPYNPIISSDGIVTINPHSKRMRKYQPHLIRQTNQRSRIYDVNGKCPAICASLFDLKITKDHKFYRKLTISECEKLMGLPLGYTSNLTRNQSGKVIGNGWQADTVKYIFKFLKDKDYG